MAKGDEWQVFKYEWDMARNLSRIISENLWASCNEWGKNAIVESLVLHTRILTDILLPTAKSKADDIKIADLIPGFTSQHTASLVAAYDDKSKGESPRVQFNKRLAHATSLRGNSHEYIDALKSVSPHIVRIVAEIRATNPPVALH